MCLLFLHQVKKSGGSCAACLGALVKMRGGGQKGPVRMLFKHVARQTAITVRVEGKFNIMTLEKEAGGTPNYDICIQPIVSVIRQLHNCPQRSAHREDTSLSSALNPPPSRHGRNAVLQVSSRAQFTGHCASREH